MEAKYVNGVFVSFDLLTNPSPRMPPTPPPTPPVQVVQPSLQEAAALFWEQLHAVASENAQQLLVASILGVVLLRVFAPTKFALIAHYAHLIIFVPFCLLLEMTIIPVLRFIATRISDKDEDRCLDRKETPREAEGGARSRKADDKQ